MILQPLYTDYIFAIIKDTVKITQEGDVSTLKS